MDQKKELEEYITREELKESYNTQKKDFDAKINKLNKTIKQMENTISYSSNGSLNSSELNNQIQELKNELKKLKKDSEKQIKIIEKKLDSSSTNLVSNDEAKINELSQSIEYLEEKAKEIKNSTDEYAKVFREELKEIAKDGRSRTAISKQEKTIKALVKDREDIQYLIDSNFDEIKASIDRFENKVNKNLEAKLGSSDFENEYKSIKSRISNLERDIQKNGTVNASKIKNIETKIDSKDYEGLYQKIELLDKKLQEKLKQQEIFNVNAIDNSNKKIKDQVKNELDGKVKKQDILDFKKSIEERIINIENENTKIKSLEQQISKIDSNELNKKIEKVNLDINEKIKENNLFNQNVITNFGQKINDNLKLEIKKLDIDNKNAQLNDRVQKIEDKLNKKIDNLDLENEKLEIYKKINEIEKNINTKNVDNDNNLNRKIENVNNIIDEKINKNNEFSQNVLNNYGKKINEGLKIEIQNQVEKLKTNIENNRKEDANRISAIENNLLEQDYVGLNKKILELESKIEEINKLDIDGNTQGIFMKLDELDKKVDVNSSEFNKLKETQKTNFEGIKNNLLQKITDVNSKINEKIDNSDVDAIYSKIDELELKLKNDASGNDEEMKEFKSEIKKYLNNVVKRVNYNSTSIENIQDNIKTNKIQINNSTKENNDKILNIEKKLKLELKDKLDNVDNKEAILKISEIQNELEEVKKENKKNEEKNKFFNMQFKNILANQQLLENKVDDLNGINSNSKIEVMVNKKLKSIQSQYEKALSENIKLLQNSFMQQIGQMQAKINRLSTGNTTPKLGTTSRSASSNRLQNPGSRVTIGGLNSGYDTDDYQNTFGKNSMQDRKTSQAAARNINSGYSSNNRKINIFDDDLGELDSSNYSGYGRGNNSSNRSSSNNLFNSPYLNDFSFDDDDDEF